MDAFVNKLNKKLQGEDKLILGNGIGGVFSPEEELGIKKLYLMYEFSDKVRLIEHSPQYGYLLNYVETGLLTWEEAEKAAMM